jgi:hypothetical protein
VPLAAPDSDGGFLTGIYAAATDDVWAIGFEDVRKPGGVRQVAVRIRCDGTDWSSQ